MKMYSFGSADWSVGIPSSEIELNIRGVKEKELTKEQINQIKELLSQIHGIVFVQTPVVQTESENKKEWELI